MTDNRKSWTIHQDQAILSIVTSVGTKNWPLVSQLMKEKYQLYHRSGKQCRQRWHNHLNPELNKQPWSQNEEQMLFQAHRKWGNRWIQISKVFGGRTDNSIKNHFYSTIRRSMRRVCKILGNRNSTSKLRNIRPSILSEIFQFSKTQSMKSHQGEQNIDISSCLLQYAKQKPRKSTQFDPTSKDDLEMLVNKLICLNDQYVNFKSQKKNTETKFESDKKTNKKQPNQKDTHKPKDLSQTNSQMSEEEYFERQHKDQIQSSNILQTFMVESHFDQQLPTQEKDEVFSQISIGEELEIESLSDNYLIIKPLQIHSMFDSTENFNEKQHQVFYYLQKPSFQEIGCLDIQNTFHSFELQ